MLSKLVWVLASHVWVLASQTTGFDVALNKLEKVGPDTVCFSTSLRASGNEMLFVYLTFRISFSLCQVGQSLEKAWCFPLQFAQHAELAMQSVSLSFS